MWEPSAGVLIAIAGGVPSTLKSTDWLLSALPALSVEEYCSECGPSPVTWNGAEYVCTPPASSEYCVDATPASPVSVAVSVTIGLRYQPLTAAGAKLATVVGAAASTTYLALLMADVLPFGSTANH